MMPSTARQPSGCGAASACAAHHVAQNTHSQWRVAASWHQALMRPWLAVKTPLVLALLYIIRRAGVQPFVEATMALVVLSPLPGALRQL